MACTTPDTSKSQPTAYCFAQLKQGTCLIRLKTGVKHNTLANYNFVVNVLKKEEFSHKKVDDVKLSDLLVVVPMDTGK